MYFALENDPRSAKAYYRRKRYRESRSFMKKHSKTLSTLRQKVRRIKAVNALVTKLKKILAAEKKKEKETWGWGFWWCQEKKKA